MELLYLHKIFNYNCIFQFIFNSNCLFQLIFNYNYLFQLIFNSNCLFQLIFNSNCLFKFIINSNCLFKFIFDSNCLRVKFHFSKLFTNNMKVWIEIGNEIFIRYVDMYHRQQVNGTPKGFYVPISKLYSIYAVANNLLAHNNITISYYWQVNSLRLKSSVASK